MVSVAGGFNKWKDEGHTWTTPRTLTSDQRNRYQRHTLLPEVGEKGQMKFLASKVLLLGAGGLGSPAALYLAAAGVGTIGIIDMDVVDCVQPSATDLAHISIAWACARSTARKRPSRR